ncbi:hypothetical protein C8R47DRAFT_1077319 [Mycena vitilis]|nr:hypothetical protein C8R47DRAFT_1077319 [Mycena vitilis]
MRPASCATLLHRWRLYRKCGVPQARVRPLSEPSFQNRHQRRHMQHLHTVLSLSAKRPSYCALVAHLRISDDVLPPEVCAPVQSDVHLSTRPQWSPTNCCQLAELCTQQSEHAEHHYTESAIARIRRIAHEEFCKNCWKTTALISDSFSCDWDYWDRLDFFEVPRSWINITRAEFVLNVQHQLPKPIIPLAFLPGNHEPHFAFEAEGEYYYYYGSEGQVWHYKPGQFSSREDFVLRLITEGEYDIAWTPQDDTVTDKMDDEQTAAARKLEGGARK